MSQKRAEVDLSANESSNDNYKAGPGYPPKHRQWKKGQSGNPSGKRKSQSASINLKEPFERALRTPVTLKIDGQETKMNAGEAGVHRIVIQFVKGGAKAVENFLLLADRLGVDLSQSESLNGAVPDYEQILLAHAERIYDKRWRPKPVMAPPELLDDDVEEQSKK